MRRDKRRRDNQPGQTREVNGKRTPRLAVGRQERRRRMVTILLPSERWNVCLTRFVFYHICNVKYHMFLCFYVFGNAPIMKHFIVA
jgi:hypothetical protein